MLTDQREPIAIVGAGCRFPDGGDDPEAFWRQLRDGVNVIREVPPQRWDVDAIYDPDPQAPGKMYSRHGGFIESFDQFDPQFYGIAPREAHEMDPQQRILLDCTWQALENAGLNPDGLRLAQVGVYVGILSMDYMVLHTKTSGVQAIDPYFASGKEFSFAAGRLSYTLGLQGPCMSINTACSSSLVAVHLAAQSLITGESDVALAAGVNMITAPELTMFLCKVGAMSPNGRCATFDAAADGIVRGEGCGVVVMKRLADAIADNDQIHAIVAGTAVNHNGPSAGLTVPNGKAQQALLQRALHVAQVDPLDVSFVECHGTGTPLGDPIEVGAIADVLGKSRSMDDPIILGSLKTNFGHMDSAAGIASVIKVMQAMKHAEIPPHLHLETLNPLIMWDMLPVTVPRELTQWTPQDKPRIAGINAFGLSGVNAHVLLKAPPEHSTPAELPHPDGSMVVLPISARTQDTLRELAEAHERKLRLCDSLTNYASTAGARRKHHEQRLTVIGSTPDELAANIESFLEGMPGPDIATGSDVGGRNRIVFAYGGQGSQWPGMGAKLLDTEPVFAAAVAECDAHFQPLAGWSMAEALRAPAEDSKLDRTDVAQPTIFALQVGLTALWRSWGIEPKGVIGHSFGEVAAAYTAKVLTLEEAVRVIYHRGRVMQPAYGKGTMAAVGLTLDEVTEEIHKYGDAVSIAAINSPHSIVLSGERGPLTEMVAALETKQIFARMLKVEFAFHSAQMAPYVDELTAALEGLAPKRTRTKFFSTIDAPDCDLPRFDGAYWARTMRQPVRFADGMTQLIAEAMNWYVECSAHPVLAKPMTQCLDDADKKGLVFSALRRDGDDVLSMRRSVASMYAAGAPVNWAGVYGKPGRASALPPYPLHPQRYWFGGIEPGDQGGAKVADLGELIGQIRLYDRDGNVLAEAGGLPLAAPGSHTKVGAPAPAPAVTAPAVSPRSAAALSAGRPASTRSKAAMSRGLEELEGVVESLVGKILGLDQKARLKRTRGFFDIGMDSITALELKRMLEATFEHKLSATVAFDHPTIERLAIHLQEILPAIDDGSDEAAEAVIKAAPQAEVVDRSKEPIAIVGMSCRFPGGADDPAAFWRMLAAGVDAVDKIPADRFDIDAIYDARRDAGNGTVYTKNGGFIKDVDLFDARFFRISPREAKAMDPQQRLFLEVAWEALEDAGVRPNQLVDTRTGAYVGMNTSDYTQLLTRNPKNVDIYFGPGNSFCAAPGRLSYFLGLRGPSLAVDTACSSSLVAVHLAIQAIHNGECDFAVAGGVSLILSPTVHISTADGGAIAADGRCKTFAKSADGYGRGEGCGVVAIKPLSKAIADGDRIRAVMLGSALNQDGPSSGLTVPNGPAQQALIVEALAAANVAPEDVSYVETHGTGTPIGDPIEIRALKNAMGRLGPGDRPLMIGSVKTNIAHLEAASGVAGLMKSVLALEHKAIPAHLHFDEPNPDIPWEGAPLVVPRALTPWDPEAERRICGVSAFGFTGTNAHIVMEAGPEVDPKEALVPGPHVLLLSGNERAALPAQAASYKVFLEGDGGALHLEDICYTASRRRQQHDHRLAVAGDTHADLIAGLGAFVEGDTKVGVVRGVAPSTTDRRPAFVFSGWGSLWKGMCRRLIDTQPVYREALERCDALMQALRPGSIVESLTTDGVTEASDRAVELRQEQLFSTHVALFELWRAHGVVPEAIVGHSLGESAAAYAAGVLSLEDAVKVAFHRTRVLTDITGKGGMGVVGLSIPDSQDVVAPYGDRLVVAVSNSPTSTVLSGDVTALEEVGEAMKKRNVFFRMVKAPGPAHSPIVEPLKRELVASLQDIRPQAGDFGMYAAVTGALQRGEDFDAEYWGRNIREAVLFSEAIRRMSADGIDAFVEVSPHPILLTPIEQGLRHFGADGVTIPTLERDEDDAVAFRAALGAAHCQGLEVDWSTVYPDGGHVVSLPPYAWQRKRFWMDNEPEVQVAATAKAGLDGAHPLLARHMRAAGGSKRHLWEVDLDLEALQYLQDYAIEGAPPVPASIYVEMALAAGAEVLGAEAPLALEAIDFAAPLLLVGGRTLQLALEPDREGGASFEIHSFDGKDPDAPSSLRAAGRIGAPGLISDGTPLDAVRARCTEEMHDVAGRLAALGASPATDRSWVFERVMRTDRELLGEVQLTDRVVAEAGAYAVHPTILSAGFELLPLSAGDGGLGYQVAGVESMRMGALTGDRFSVSAALRPQNGGGSIVGDLQIFDGSGQLRGEALGLRFAPIAGKVLQEESRRRISQQLYEIEWQVAAAAGTSSDDEAAGRWLVLGGADFGAAVAGRLGGVSLDGDAVKATSIGAAVQAELTEPCAGIVNLLALDAASVGDTRAYDATLALAKALHQTEAPLPIWFVTAGAQPVIARSTADLALAQAPLWGLARVIGLEHHALWGGLVDLDPGATAAAANVDALVATLTCSDGEDHIALRRGRRYVARLVRRSPEPVYQPPKLDAKATYLVSDGLSEVGMAVARWLVGHGARHIAVTGADDAGVPDDVAALKAEGVDIRTFTVHRVQQLPAAFERMRAAMPPLAGVVHVAASWDVAFLKDLPQQDMRLMFERKGLAAYKLHELTAGMELDLFVLLSSVGSMWGSMTVGHYALADQLLDVLACHRRRSGLPATTLCLGPFDDAGLLSQQDRIIMSQGGIEARPIAEALEALEVVLALGRTCTAVAQVDWGLMKPLYEDETGWSLITEMQPPEGEGDGLTSAGQALVRLLEAAALEDRMELLVNHVLDELTVVFGFDSADDIEPDQGFFEMGMNSVMSLQFKLSLEKNIGCQLPATLAFEYPTAVAVAGFLASDILSLDVAAATNAVPAPAAAAPVLVDEDEDEGLEDLSDDELLALMDEELAASDELLE